MPFIYPVLLDRAGIAFGEEGLSMARVEGDIVMAVSVVSQKKDAIDWNKERDRGVCYSGRSNECSLCILNL